MADWTVAQLVEDLKAGRIDRRRFIAVLASAGIGMPLISMILAACGSSNNNNSGAANNNASKTNSLVVPSKVAGTTAPRAAPVGASPAAAAFTPTKRGGGGPLKLLWWQAVSILNPHMSNGTKDQNGSRIFLEPLADFDPDGNLVPILAAEVPSVDKGTLAKDLSSVTWKLKQGVKWHDGQPFNADDVIFNFQYQADPDTASFNSGHYNNVSAVDKVDDYTVKVTFKQPTLAWADAFVGDAGMLIPKHVHEQYKGKQAKDAPANLKPVGTGPYKLRDFRPNDTVLADINPDYHLANRPFFDSIEMKGGGDAPSAARAVLETGEYDYAWNLQVEAQQLLQMEAKGVGRLLTWNGGNIEHIEFNFTDPNKDVDGEKSSIKAPHPFFSDKNVRQAFTLSVDRKVLVDQLYGPTGVAGTFWDYTPQKYVPSTPDFKPDPAKANQLLDAAGWAKGGDGIRAKGGVKMHVLYQTSVNDLRQKEQQIVKANFAAIGVDTELKSVDQAIFFAGDPGNPDNFSHFYADLQMFTSTRSGPDDGVTFFNYYISSEVKQKANNWSKRNQQRYQNPDFDKLHEQLRSETDPVKAADLIKKMNQFLNDDFVIIPLVGRNNVSAAKKNLQGMNPSGWANELWWLAYWYRA